MFAPSRHAAQVGLNFTERVLHFQLDTMRRYMDLALGQARAAMEVNDPESLRRFVGEQGRLMRDLGEAVNEDFKILSDMGKSFSEDVEKVGRETTEAMEASGGQAEQRKKSA
jgi:phasin family protein